MPAEPAVRRAPIRALAGWWVPLILLAFIQSPGRIVADTKHDLSQEPVGFLARSLSIWSETMPLGQLQNQAYGYLFPHGAFFALADAAHVPAWIAQALWWSLLLSAAFTGFYRLAEAAGVGRHGARVLAALLYAVSPRIISTVSAISSEAWAVALAPWIAVPLVRVIRSRPGTTTRWQVIRGALSSAAAVLLTGAVNATSTAAACVVAGVLVLAAGLFGPARARAWGLLAAWIPATILASIWWLVPLLLLGRYSPPFTDYIESAGVTTRWLNLAEVLRGTTSWAPFVSVEREGGNALVSEPFFVVATMAVTAVGVAGLAMRSMPARRTWWLVGAVGVAAMAAWTWPFAPLEEPGRAFLDGAGAALRNVHKFDSVWRIPLLMGVAHLTAQVLPPHLPRGARDDAPGGPASSPAAEEEGRADRRRAQGAALLAPWLHPEKHPRAIGAMALVVIAACATAPAWTGRLAPGQPFEQVPAYWAEAADWLNANARNSRTLVEPAMPFGDQEWGFTRDEPIQPLAEVPWTVRDSVPLVPPEAIRGLDGLQDALDRGEGSPTLAATLRAQGVGHILVKHDYTRTGRTADGRAIARTLAASPGLRPVADFGDGSRGGLVIWEVEGAGDALAPRIAPLDVPHVAVGGPEVLPRLDEVDGAATARVLWQDAAAPVIAARPGPVPVTVTDTPATRSRNYGEVDNAVTAIRPEDDEPRVANPVPDYPIAGAPMTSVLESGGTVTASSEADDPYNFGGTQPAHSVTSLVDGDPSTWWMPARGHGQAEHVDVTLPGPMRLKEVALTGAERPFRVQVRTDSASTSAQVFPGETAHVAVPGGATSTVRVTATQAPLGFALSEVRLIDEDGTDVTPSRVPAVPPAPEGSTPVRWVLGQEIPEGTMRRLIEVPRDVTVRVDTDACRRGADLSWARIGDGPELECGAEVPLPAGPHVVSSKARWTALTDVAAYPVAPVTGDVVAADVAPADVDRVIWRPLSANDGLRATVGGVELTPVLVDGWQQAWIVPAGVSGAFAVDFPAESAWRGGIVAGGVLAALVALAAVVVRRLVPEPEPVAPVPGEPGADLPAAVAPVATTALAVLVAGPPGLAVAAVVQGAAAMAAAVARRRAPGTWGRRAPGLAAIGAGSLVALAGVIASRAPWPEAGYLAATWGVQLLLVAALSLLAVAQTLPSHRRAGSSTSA
ncbi:alpha-(1-_3)-arabinofuranosyltransferase family protein [Corynebacterium sp.]|uniref:alpha-(1->3)-arabinofuranosyltransferase domain-containing protein n=1 Tax=Corynebacterium sp. TaxID=1720 RepID=UPI0026DBBA0F|nr:alpha-(1->3)-arabinofuranosyltransferase family protein [Corynebacterium sp.]MDO4610253.1 alpha-(1->3)-arabinofuranosyltransferase family protein [Corynebacterium sp.]